MDSYRSSYITDPLYCNNTSLIVNCWLSVCVCVCILFHREGFFRLQDVLDILEGTDQRCCVVSIIRCAAAKFLHLGI